MNKTAESSNDIKFHAPFGVHHVLAAILVLHIITAYFFAKVTPYRTAGVLLYQGRAQVQDIGAPDERQHVNYVARLVQGEGFPVLGDQGEDPYENYQAHQPPLYYVLASGYCKLFGHDEFESERSGASLRMLNAFIGALGVLGIAALAYWATLRKDVALTAALFASMLPMNAALSGAVSNDPLLITICSWTLAFMVRAQRYGWCWGAVFRIGLLIGLGLLAKTNALALLLTLPVFLWFSQDPAGRKKLAMYGVATATIAVFVALPWWMRNQSLYGDPLALGAFQRAFEGSPKASMFISELGAYEYWTKWVGWWTLRSFVGVFGYMDIFLPTPIYIVALLSIVGLAASGALRSKDVTKGNAISLWPLGCFMLVVGALFIRFNMQYFQGQARYLLPALGPIALAFGIGLLRISRTAATSAFAATLALALALNFYVARFELPREFEKRVVNQSAP